MLARLIRYLTGSPAATNSAMSSGSSNNPAQGVTKVYKILETAKSDPRYLFPVPIPASHEFFLPPLDYKDGFVHMSTSTQLAATLQRFFASHKEVVLLKMDYARLSGFKPVKWESTSSGQIFPHLYGYGIEGENVESFKEVVRQGEGEKVQSWDETLEELKRAGWLEH